VARRGRAAGQLTNTRLARAEPATRTVAGDEGSRKDPPPTYRTRDGCNHPAGRRDTTDRGPDRHLWRGLPTTGGPGARHSRPADRVAVARPRYRGHAFPGVPLVMRLQCPPGGARDGCVVPIPTLPSSVSPRGEAADRYQPRAGACDGAPSPRSRGRPEPPPPGVPHVQGLAPAPSPRPPQQDEAGRRLPTGFGRR
jgi:hypothetical protein